MLPSKIKRSVIDGSVIGGSAAISVLALTYIPPPFTAEIAARAFAVLGGFCGAALGKATNRHRKLWQPILALAVGSGALFAYFLMIAWYPNPTAIVVLFECALYAIVVFCICWAGLSAGEWLAGQAPKE